MERPKIDEVCVYCFGPGYGESFVVHLGANQWIIIDSCMLPDKRVAALWLLDELGVDLSQSVNQFIVTHWHDDHIRGAGKIAEKCKKSNIILPTVFSKKEFSKLARLFGTNSAEYEKDGTNEVMEIFDRGADRIRYAAENSIIEDKSIQIDGNDVRVQLYGISPSSRQVTNFIMGLSGYIPEAKDTKRKLPDRPTNEASLATVLVVNDICMIFGADLEETAGFPGWTDALTNWKIPVHSFSFFKVAHHGGVSGHSANLWSSFLIQDVFGIVAPWNRSTKLPQESDLERIASLSNNCYCTSSISETRFTHEDNTVQKSIREGGIKIRKLILQDNIVKFSKNIFDHTNCWDVKYTEPSFRISGP